EAVKRPYQTVAAATYSEDDTFTFNGTQFLVSGRDWDPDTHLPVPGATEVNGILTTENPTNIANALQGNQINNVEGAGAEPSVQASPINMHLEALAPQFAAIATISLPGSTIPDPAWGHNNNYNIVHCPGGLHTSGNGQGGGVLII